MRPLLAVLLFAAPIAGCQPRGPEPEAALPAAAAATGAALTGPVLEQLGATPYLYLRLRTAQGEVWAAVPEAEIKDGAVVTVSNPMLMSNFESTTLKRTFDAVYFGTLATGTPGADLPAGHPEIGSLPSAAPPIEVGPVARATGADARTVSETWAERAGLAGKSVTIRGVVAKYNEGVMGKNWIHLRDGSGDPAAGSNDITVTSLEVAAVGDTVTITGTVRTDVDVGMGYRYPVLVEGARVLKR